MSSWTTPAVSCRICKTSEFEDLSDALETTIDNSFNRVLLADIVYNTLGIQIKKDDGLSIFICKECSRKIIPFYCLKINHMDVDTIFQNPTDPNVGCQEVYGVVKQYITKHMYAGVRVEEINEQLVISAKSADPIAFLAVCPDIAAVSIKLENEEEHHSDPNEMSFERFPIDEVKQEINYESLIAIEQPASSKSSECSSTSSFEDDVRPLKKKKKYKTSQKGPKKQYSHCSKSNRECEICGKLIRHYVMKYAYESHLKMHTGFDFLLAGNHLKFHECEVCKKLFGCLEDLINHFDQHCNRPFINGNYECGNCSNIYQSQEKLKEHVYFFHLKNIECPIPNCGTVVRYQYAFHYHLLSIHPEFITTITRHNCDHCYAEFSSFDQVKKHKDNCPCKSLECRSCNKKFASELSIKAHRCIALDVRSRNKRKSSEEDDENSLDHLESFDSRITKVEDFPESTTSSSNFAEVSSKKMTRKSGKKEKQNPEISCPKCFRVLKTLHGLKKHCKWCCPTVVIQTAKPRTGLFCSICDKKTSCRTEKDLAYHKKECVRQQKKRALKLTCSECQLSFLTMEELKNHCRIFCPTASVLTKCKKSQKTMGNPICTKCLIRFDRDNTDLHRPHMDMHTAFEFLLERRFLTFIECEQCLMVFKTEEELLLHSAVHSSGGPSDTASIPCHYCQKEHSTEFLAKEHFYFKHQNHFICPVETCRLEQKKFGVFYYHIQGVHPGLIENITEFVCSYCEDIFDSYLKLKIHRLKCSGKTFACTHCDKVYGNQRLLSVHMRQVANPSYCETCGKACVDSTQLRLHMLIHSTEKSFKCGLCDATFTTANARGTHSKSHSVERKFPCDLCSYVGTFHIGLTRHKNAVHSGRVYCPICENILSSKKVMYNHLRGVHKVTNDEILKMRGTIRKVDVPSQ